MNDNVVYHKNLKFGPFDMKFGDYTKHNCYAGIEVELRTVHNKDTELSICGSVYHVGEQDWIYGGQCIDRIAKLVKDPKVQRINEVWQRWHLNCMHAGCEHQREFEHEPYEKHAGAHCDICDYTYGTAWLTEQLPQEIIDEVKSW